MFGIFKKKPLEVKHGRDNYLADYATFEANDRNWILMMSALFVEAKDLDMWGKRASHDLLEIYAEGVLDDDEKNELAEVLEEEDLETNKNIKKRVQDICSLNPRSTEDDIYIALNATSLKDVQEKALRENEDDDEIQELMVKVWKNKEHYENTHLRLGFIVHTMWHVRMAVTLGIVHPDVAWCHLETLADHARPIMALFSSWEAYNENLEKFKEIHDYDALNDLFKEGRHIERAKVCLLKREESPLHLIDVAYGVDKKYPYNLKSHSLIYPKHLPSGQTAIHLMFLELLEREDKTKLWEELEKLEAKKKEEMALFVMGTLRKTMPVEDILELPERYENVHAYATRAEHFYYFAWEARGSGTADTVGEENYNLFHERLGWSLDDLDKAHELDPSDRNVWHDFYENLSYFSSEESEEKSKKLYELIRKEALDHRGCVNGISRHKETRWGGSFEENLDWAREVIAGTKKGTPSRLIIFEVMIEHADYIESFQEDKKAAKAFLKSKEVLSEVNQYMEELLENIDEAPYEIVDVLSYFYSEVGDIHRLRQVIHASQIGKFDLDAMNDEYDERYVEMYMNWFRSL